MLISAPYLAVLENRIRSWASRRGVGVWVYEGAWGSGSICVKVMSYRKGSYGAVMMFTLRCLDFAGHLDVGGTVRTAKGKIKSWKKSLRKNP